MISNRSMWMAVLATASLATACGGGAPAAKPANPPATTAASSGAATVAAGDFGVPECDNYMKKYVACIDSKVPEAGRAMMRQALDQQKAAWKQAASTPEGRSALATGCKAAEDQAKVAVQAYGCTW
jgi:hypothetical protein